MADVKPSGPWILVERFTLPTGENASKWRNKRSGASVVYGIETGLGGEVERKHISIFGAAPEAIPAYLAAFGMSGAAEANVGGTARHFYDPPLAERIEKALKPVLGALVKDLVEANASKEGGS